MIPKSLEYYLGVVGADFGDLGDLGAMGGDFGDDDDEDDEPATKKPKNVTIYLILEKIKIKGKSPKKRI